MTINKFGLTNNQLKIIALIAMLSDHIGKEFFPQYKFLQIIGRLALPIFAYMIAEGCLYTRNRKNYLLKIALLAFGCQIVYFIAERSLYQNILVTFTLSVITVYAIDNFLKKKDLLSGILMFSEALSVSFICIILPQILKTSGFHIDYGLFGVLLPVVVYFARGNIPKLIGMMLCLIAVAIDLGSIQWFSLLAIVPIVFYNGKRGKLNLKYLFYIFYPAHLAVIYIVKLIIENLGT